MLQDKKGFRILNGFRHSALTVQANHAPCHSPHISSPSVYRENPRTEDPSEQAQPHTIEQVNRLMHGICQMIQGLDVGVVREFDLMTELQALKSTYAQIGSMQISLDLHPAAIEVLTKEEEREILSIAREALSNSVRHARATQAAISIRKRGDRIRLRISDDGQGFAGGNGRRGGAMALQPWQPEQKRSAAPCAFNPRKAEAQRSSWNSRWNPFCLLYETAYSHPDS